jgi:hypothetical protein
MTNMSHAAVLAGAFVVIAIAAMDSVAARSNANKGSTTVVKAPSAPSPVAIPYPNATSPDPATGHASGRRAHKPPRLTGR